MVRFAEKVSTEEIIEEVENLLKHSKDIRELELYLQELRHRKLKFKKRMIEEMTEPLASINRELGKFRS